MSGPPHARDAELRQQLAELGRWMRGHPVWAVVAVVLLLAFINQIVGPPPSGAPAELAAGDCLVIHVSSPASSPTGPSAQPRPLIGDPEAVEAVLMAGGALRAGCGTAHDHEVSAVMTLAEPAAAAFPGRETLLAEVGSRCDDAFPGYVGGPLAGSRYITNAAVPTADAWAAGARTAVCLVARADGRLMDHPARGSRE